MHIAIRLFRFVSVLMIFVVPQASAGASSTDLSGMEIVNVPLVSWLKGQPRATPNSMDDLSVDDATRANFRQLVRALATADWAGATGIAADTGYEIVLVRDHSGEFIVASERGQTGQKPTIVVNLHPGLKLIAGAPHASFETGTVEEAALLVSEAGGHFAVIAAAHRCASRTFVSCDGKTSVCGAPEAYRTSDVAHNPDSLFHMANTELVDLHRDYSVMSLHGMRSDDKEVPTSIIVSHGYKAPDSTKTSDATRLRHNLATFFGSDGQVVSCDLPSDDKYEARRLCGYTNVQGRYVNSDDDVCVGSISSGSGRFIHIEQDWSVLRAFNRNWASDESRPIIDAFIAATIASVPELEEK